MTRHLRWLEDITREDRPLVGGKAAALAELRRAGLPVPPTVVVLSRACETFLRENGLEEHLSLLRSPEEAAAGEGGHLTAPAGPPLSHLLEEFQAEVRKAPLPAGLLKELEEALSSGPLRGTPLAVRSSSPAEDGRRRSAAGVYESRLNVRGLEEVVAAVRDCWASLWTERAFSYVRPVRASSGTGAARAPSGPPGEDGTAPPDTRAMAVLIQALVPCEVSGILFTLNPLTADENEMLVEATWGLASGLASGEVSPDRFVVHFWEGRALRSEPGRKPEALVPAEEGGLRPVPLDREKSRTPCLHADRLAELAALGRRVQEVFGEPQDVEFGFAGGRLYVLQSRPITTYTFPESTGQWTTANFREVMPGFASILGQSQSFHHDFSRAQEELFRRVRLWRPEDEGTVWARTFFGHGYWNVGATKRVASRLPGFRERSFDRTVGIDPTYEGEGRVTPWTPVNVLRAVPVLLALERQYRTVPGEVRSFLEWFDREEPVWDAVRPEDLDDESLSAWAAKGLELHAKTNRWALITTLLSTQAQEDFHGTLAALEKKGLGDDAPSEARLLTGLTGMATARPLEDLWGLARTFEKHPRALERLRRTPPAELAGRLAELAGKADEGEAWRAVLDWVRRYRYMSNIDEDLSVPRWWEDPSVPLSLLRGYVTGEGRTTRSQPPPRGGGPADDPRVQLERQRAVREAEEKKALALGRRWLRLGLSPFWRRRFEEQYRRVKEFCWLREETRVYLSRARYQTRRFLVELARRWAEAGLLDEPDDIFWLTRDEVLELTGGRGDPAAAREAARRRKALRRLYRNWKVPQNITPGTYGPEGLPLRRAAPASDGPGTGPRSGPDTGTEKHGGPTYTGVGCSAGVVTARCRVAGCIEEAAALQAGEILVAPYANPAWTPLFHLAEGLVLEEGGLLSHSAVVAREYGVPAVLQVKGATKLFRTGDILTIDGLKGTVTLTGRR
ncbi:MAG TPA: hypothetical protein DGR79_06535 [Clostridiales bacterium]|nr:hypothetical protein [Clostridiales bacterium]